MVTRAVENAQKRIEGMYFESRKHIVQYDDVSNEQRKVIFAFRNQLLDKDFDISQKLLENRKEYLKTLLESFSIFEGLPQEDYNLEGLVSALKEELKLNIEFNELESLDADEVFEKVLQRINSEYETKMSVLDPFIRKMVEKEICLKNLDKGWREHLYQLDTLKTGIGLRGYNQKDPLVEYKKESFFLFNDLIISIKFETIKTLQLIQFRDPEEESKDFIEEQEQEKKITEKQNELRQEFNRQPHRVEKKPKRNESCPCGSEKKYKHCCGISGPKKGIFAQ